jgi:transcriptional regulator with XRE-family HTH domain
MKGLGQWSFHVNLMITGYKIRLARQMKGLAAKYVADELDMDYSTYSRIERGETKLTEERVEALLAVLKVDRNTLENIEDVILNNGQSSEKHGDLFDLIRLQLQRNADLLNELIQILLRDKN